MSEEKNYWAQNSSCAFIEATSRPVLEITREGRIIWNDREVKTDDDLRAAMVELNKKLRSLQVPAYYCNNELLEALKDCREALRRAGAIGELRVVDAAIAKAEGASK